VKRSDEDAFREYVTARLDRLRRMAYLLCRDWHTADDLVSVTLGKLYRNWRRARRATNPDAYLRAILVRALIDERRRPWHRESVVDTVPEIAVTDRHRVLDRMALLDVLAPLTPRRRAAVVLRFYCDLSVEDTAEILGCSTGTVKSLTARALEALRTPTTATLVSRSRSAPWPS
jgi:RNA polymerase sigma-70 factor (sigma-E family)